MAFVSRGFRGRRAEDVDAARVPPGQYVTRDFPVLSAGPTPHTPLERWDFSIIGAVDEPRRWTWEEFRALPSESSPCDIHCVTKWSKLDTRWRGVSVDTLLEGVETAAEYVTAFCDGGYTTNLPLEDVTAARRGSSTTYDGAAARARARRPRAPARPAPLLLEERQVGPRPAAARSTTSRASGRPTATTTTETHGRNSATGATDLAARASVVESIVETPTSRRSSSTCPAGPATAPGQHVDVRLTAEDGYQAERSYSIASAPERHPRRAHGRAARRRRGLALPDRRAAAGRPDRAARPDRRLLRLGAADGGPLLLVAGGSGIVPLMAMLRHRAAASTPTVETRLLYSARGCDDLIYRDELEHLTRRRAHRASHADRAAARLDGLRAARRRRDARRGRARRSRAARFVYVCGPTPFVEAVADALVRLGHEPRRIKTERFGPTGG